MLALYYIEYQWHHLVINGLQDNITSHLPALLYAYCVYTSN